MAKIIVVGALKGGVGKTNIANNVCGILAEKGHRVLGIDNDLQGNFTNNCGVNRLSKELKTMKDVYDTESSVKFKDVVFKSPIKELPSFDIIPSSLLMHHMELRMGSVPGREFILRNFIDDNIQDINTYDYIIIDTNPSMSIINQNAFYVADSIVLISDMDENSLEGVDLFIGLWANIRKNLKKEDNIKGIVINIVDKRESTITSDCFEFIEDENRDYLKSLIFENMIPRNTKMRRISKLKKPINLIDKKADGYLALCELITEMKDKGVL